MGNGLESVGVGGRVRKTHRCPGRQWEQEGPWGEVDVGVISGGGTRARVGFGGPGTGESVDEATANTVAQALTCLKHSSPGCVTVFVEYHEFLIY